MRNVNYSAQQKNREIRGREKYAYLRNLSKKAFLIQNIYRTAKTLNILHKEGLQLLLAFWGADASCHYA